MSPESKPMKETLRVILDSNALFVPLQFRIDIFEELEKLLKTRFELILLHQALLELEKLAQKGSPKTRKDASFALMTAKKCKVVQLDEQYSRLSPDDAVVQLAREWRCAVFTNDRELRKRLRNINVPVIYVRQKSRLEIDGRI